MYYSEHTARIVQVIEDDFFGNKRQCSGHGVIEVPRVCGVDGLATVKGLVLSLCGIGVMSGRHDRLKIRFHHPVMIFSVDDAADQHVDKLPARRMLLAL